MKLDLALSLFSLVARDKVDPERSDLAELAGQLGRLMEERHGLAHEAVAIEAGATVEGDTDLYLVFLGVPNTSWPAFLALCEVQGARPYAFRTDDEGRFTMHPLGGRGD